MAKINHNISAPNDGLGDQLRTAFGNQNAMNTELYENKVDKAIGKDLSDNNFTDEDVIKLNAIAAGAEVNIQPDWEQNDNTAKDYIKNKPLEMFSSVGSFHYVDLATQTTPLTVLATVEKKITNDTLNPLTNVLNAPYGVTSMWNTVNNQLDFTQTSIGDLITIIPEVEITTTIVNQDYQIYIKLGIGSDFPVTKQVYNGSLKTIGSIIVSPARDFTIDTLDIKDYPGEIFVLSEANATVKSGALDIKVVRKDINVVGDHAHTNLALLETITSTLKSNWIDAYAWVLANGTNVLNHLSNTLNPHSVTKSQVGLGNVDNTSDVNKPVSTAQQTALNLKQATLVSATNIKTINGVSVLGSGNLVIVGDLTEYISYACSDETTNLTLGDKISIRMPFAMTLSEVRLSLNVAPTITKLIADVKENGVSIFSTLPSIDTSELTSVTAAIPAVISDVNLVDDALLVVSVTQIGSGDIGKGLKITLKGIRI